MLLALAFDCFFGIGTASLTYLMRKLYKIVGCQFVIICWGILISQVGYDFVLFSRMKDVEYLYEKNMSRKLDVLFSICVFIGNFCSASRLYSLKLETCEKCSKTFQQLVSISEYICVCVCQGQDCKRLAKYCEKCKSANLTIMVTENIPKYRILLVVPFVGIMAQHLILIIHDQFDFDAIEKAKEAGAQLDNIEYLLKLEMIREVLEIVVDSGCRYVSGFLFLYITIRVLVATYMSLTSSIPSIPILNETHQIDEKEPHNKVLSDLKELIKSQQEEHTKRTKKLLQQQKNENERQESIEKKLNNQKKTFDEQFKELTSQCMDIRAKIDNQEKQQELFLKLILDLSKETSATGGPS